ncbi:MAG: T9SS type A sorting domain-containing protein [Flavobacteriaceae bacterium]|nr:T9SS type A sorting domain-containing protein [Flavobacteriaceae bacterium]
MTTDWGEGASNSPGEEGGGTAAIAPDTTWIDAILGSTLWTSPGGDFAGISTSTSIAGPGTYVFPTSPQLVADVQNWLDGVNPNFGWVVLGNEGVTASAKRFASRENLTVANRPTLSITYDNALLSVTDVSQQVSELVIYPNPSDSGIFTIQSQSQINQVEVFDILGSKITTKQFSSENPSIDLSRFSSGIYFLKIRDNIGKFITKRVIRK